MLHVARDTPFGCVLRSRFVLGLDSAEPQRDASDAVGLGLLRHCYTEFSFLSRLLPSLYYGERANAFATELDQAEAVAERIGQYRDVAPVTLAHRLLQRCSSSNRTRQRGRDVIHHPVQMQRRPMALVVAHVAVLGGGAACLVVQQVQRGRPAEQFHGARAEAAGDAQAEGFGSVG
ncbi:hypothetical protein G6F62_014253 [Rhizopus arrhizus]|nr:hypothetical protein G6F62_014253 [Rhizopus arrhizus]